MCFYARLLACGTCADTVSGISSQIKDRRCSESDCEKIKRSLVTCVPCDVCGNGDEHSEHVEEHVHEEHEEPSKSRPKPIYYKPLPPMSVVEIGPWPKDEVETHARPEPALETRPHSAMEIRPRTLIEVRPNAMVAINVPNYSKPMPQAGQALNEWDWLLQASGVGQLSLSQKSMLKMQPLDTYKAPAKKVDAAPAKKLKPKRKFKMDWVSVLNF